MREHYSRIHQQVRYITRELYYSMFFQLQYILPIPIIMWGVNLEFGVNFRGWNNVVHKNLFPSRGITFFISISIPFGFHHLLKVLLDYTLLMVVSSFKNWKKLYNSYPSFTSVLHALQILTNNNQNPLLDYQLHEYYLYISSHLFVF